MSPPAIACPSKGEVWIVQFGIVAIRASSTRTNLAIAYNWLGSFRLSTTTSSSSIIIKRLQNAISIINKNNDGVRRGGGLGSTATLLNWEVCTSLFLFVVINFIFMTILSSKKISPAQDFPAFQHSEEQEDTSIA